MQDITIPGWALYLVIGMIGWLLFLTRENFQNNKDIAVNKAMNKQFQDELVKITEAIAENRAEAKEWFQKLEHKIDLYLLK